MTATALNWGTGWARPVLGAAVGLLGAKMLVAAVLLILSLLALGQRSPEPVS